MPNFTKNIQEGKKGSKSKIISLQSIYGNNSMQKINPYRELKKNKSLRTLVQHGYLQKLNILYQVKHLN